MARRDERPPGKRTVACSILTFGNILSLIITTAMLSLPLIQEWHLSITGEDCALITGKLPSTAWLG